MKRWGISLALTLLPTVGYCAVDRIGSERFEVNRSSVTKGQDTQVVIATGPIILREVVVSSGTAGSWIEFYDSTAPATTIVTSTLAACATATTGNTFPYGQILNKGLAYTKFGVAGIDIHWDRIINP